MNDKIKYLRDRISGYVSTIPFIFMSLNLIAFTLFFLRKFWEISFNQYPLFYNIGYQVFDFSGMALILMFATSKNYRLLSWISFSCLCLLWVVNTLYRAMMWEVDLYFCIISVVVFTIFVIISVSVITKRILN